MTMSIQSKLIALFTIALGLSLPGCDAVRGARIHSTRRRRGGSLISANSSKGQRSLETWGGVTHGSIQVREGAHIPWQGLPEATERRKSGDFSSHSKKTKGKKSKNRKNGGEVILNEEIECDDPEDPRCIECNNPSCFVQACDHPDDPRCSGGSIEIDWTTGSGEVLADTFEPTEDGSYLETYFPTDTYSPSDTYPPTDEDSKLNYDLEPGDIDPTGEFRPALSRNPSVMERVLTPFQIKFTLRGKVFEPDLDDGDYAEISETTELYLTEFFGSYYTDEPTEFYEVEVMVQKTADPLTVRFFVSASFKIPGNVPLMSNIFDRVTAAFSGTGAYNYINLLGDMGVGNPFRNTVAIALINEHPSLTTNNASNSDTHQSSYAIHKPTFLSVVIGTGVLVLVIIGLLFAWQKKRFDDEIQRLRLECQAQKMLPDAKEMSKPFDNDTATFGYIRKIRKHYRDCEDSRTSTEDEVHGMDKDVEEGHATNANSHQIISEMHQAMNALQSLSSLNKESTAEGLVPQYPAPPSDCDKEEPKQHNNDEHLNYLDLQSSFEEEDLRN